MAANPEVSVTLSNAMLTHLRRQAVGLGVSIELLVAGLVCDTIEVLADGRLGLPGPMPVAGPSSFSVE